MEYAGNTAKKIHEGPHALARLRALGLTEEDVIITVQTSEIERRSCSSLEPSVAPGFKAWVAAFRTLAEQLVPRGWVKTETKGLPRILNPETAVGIAVVTGDEGTGRVHGEPRSKTPRGEQSIFLVRSNERQMGLPFPDQARRFIPLPAEVEQITWWLLIHSDGDRVRAELSLPIGLGDDHRLSVWEERIVIDLPDLSLPPNNREDEEPPLDLEITVRPRR